MKKLVVLIALVTLFLGVTGVVYAAQNIYGVTGLIETPDDVILGTGDIGLTANYLSGIRHLDGNFFSYGGAFGVFPRLEVGAVAFDSDAEGVSTNVSINGKYRVLNESLKAPAITIGVVDVANQLDSINPEISDPSLFVVFGKNLTSVAEGVCGTTSKPLRGTLGFGMGIYKGLFAGLNWSLTPQFNVMGEFLSNGIRQDSTINAAVGYTPINRLTLRAGVFDFSDLYVGATYTISVY